MNLYYQREPEYEYDMRIAKDGNVYLNKVVDKVDNNYYLQPSQNSVLNNVYANAYYSLSDKRAKENIKPLQDSQLTKIMRLNGVEFKWKDDKETHIGLVAQDVEKVFPELVSTDKNGMKSIGYANLVAPLIEAIKEQQKEIESLKSNIDALKKR